MYSSSRAIHRINGAPRGVAAMLLGVALVGLTFCNTWSLKSDQKANDALLALKKLDARIETGISYSDYSGALGEVNYSVKQFLESDKSTSVPEFSNSLRNAMKWHSAATQIWRRQLNAPVPVGYCDSAGLSEFQAKDLCDAYPQLVTTVPGTIPTSGRAFSIAMVNATILFSAYSAAHGKDYTGSLGLIYDLAVRESWLRAALEVNNAQHSLNGEKLEKAEDKSFKAEKKAEIGYLYKEATKHLESQH